MGYFHPANGRWYSSDRDDELEYEDCDYDEEDEVENNHQDTSKIHCYYDSENDEYYWAENCKSHSNNLTKKKLLVVQ